MRMLVKYTAYVDFDRDGTETDRSYYLSFVKKDDVMDIPFESMEELQKKAGKFTIADYVKTEGFKTDVAAYDDFQDFFKDVDTLVLYEESVPVDLSSLLS